MGNKLWSVAFGCALAVTVVGCAGDDDPSPKDETALGTKNPDGKPGDTQTPPTTNGSAVEAWLKLGDYERWTCETMEHAQLKVSPHGFNRAAHALALEASNCRAHQPARASLTRGRARVARYLAAMRAIARSSSSTIASPLGGLVALKWSNPASE